MIVVHERVCVCATNENQMTSRTHEVYKGLPVSDLSSAQRGTIIEGVVQRFLEDKYGTAATFPTEETRCDGRKRGRSAATYDYFIGGKRHEVKSAQLVWECSYRTVRRTPFV